MNDESMCIGCGQRLSISWMRKPGPRWRRSHSMPIRFVTFERVTNRSRPQRTKSAASKTGSNSLTVNCMGSPAFRFGTR